MFELLCALGELGLRQSERTDRMNLFRTRCLAVVVGRLLALIGLLPRAAGGFGTELLTCATPVALSASALDALAATALRDSPPPRTHERAPSASHVCVCASARACVSFVRVRMRAP